MLFCEEVETLLLKIITIENELNDFLKVSFEESSNQNLFR